MKIDLLVPRSDDRIGRLSAQIADITRDHLTAQGHEVTRIGGDTCCEGALAGRAERADGSAFFGHGQVDHLAGSDEKPLFAGDGAERLRGAWLHGFACDAGADFAARVLRHGPTVVVGYTKGLRSNWSFETMDPKTRAAVDGFVTRTTTMLASGETDATALRVALAAALDGLIAVGAGDPVVLFAQGLVRGLVVRRPDRQGLAGVALGAVGEVRSKE